VSVSSPGTTGEEYAEENVPGAEIVGFENPGDLLTALVAGTIDAVLQDAPVNEDHAASNRDGRRRDLRHR
jgi:polar amino acid transport system substrate-binding protein